jgi:hypothetical protein
MKKDFGTSLTRNEMKKVNGGSLAPPAGGTCQAKVMTGNGSYTVLVGLSSGDAQQWASGTGGNWCCDSCSTASWSVKQS